MNLTTTGRQRHEHKITVYLSADELHRLDVMLAHIRYRLSVPADRGRVVREALALAYRDVDLGGPNSALVQRLLADDDDVDKPTRTSHRRTA